MKLEKHAKFESENHNDLPPDPLTFSVPGFRVTLLTEEGQCSVFRAVLVLSEIFFSSNYYYFLPK